MSILNKTQNAFLEEFLRGTKRGITGAFARDAYGIKNLRARMTEFRNAGLKVNTVYNKGRATYTVSQRDVAGTRAKVFA